MPAGLSADIDRVLLVFGLAALMGIWIVGLLIDRLLQVLLVISCTLFAAAALALGLWIASTEVVYLSVAIWGLALAACPPCCKPRWPNRPVTRRMQPSRCW